MNEEDFYNNFQNKKLKIKNTDKLKEYIHFCLSNQTEYKKYSTAHHHILPQCKKMFPEFKNEKFNIVCLTHMDHYIAHSLLFESIDSIYIGYCWFRMNGVSNHYKRDSITPEQIIGPIKYQELRKNYLKILSEKQKNRKLSNETKRKISESKHKIENNGLSNATNSARKAMITMKSKLWDGLSYIEWQQKNNRGRKMKKEWIEKQKLGMKRIEENGKSVAQNAAEKGIITRSKKIINGIPYNEYCSLKFKENNPMHDEKIVEKVKEKLHQKSFEYNGKFFTPLEYRSINTMIKGKWFLLKNIFNKKINIILPHKIIQKLNLYGKTKENYYGKYNSAKTRLISSNKEKLIGCYCEEIIYDKNIIPDVSIYLNMNDNDIISSF